MYIITILSVTTRCVVRILISYYFFTGMKYDIKHALFILLNLLFHNIILYTRIFYKKFSKNYQIINYSMKTHI